MRIILLQNLEPFVREVPDCPVAKLVRRRHLAPDEHTLHVTPEEKSLVLDFLVLPERVKTKRMNIVDVCDQRLFIRRSKPRLRPIPLVENHAEIQRTAIEQNMAFVRADLAHTKIRPHFINRIFAARAGVPIPHAHFAAEIQPQIIERRVFRTPPPKPVRTAVILHDAYGKVCAERIVVFADE